MHDSQVKVNRLIPSGTICALVCHETTKDTDREQSGELLPTEASATSRHAAQLKRRSSKDLAE